MTYSQACSCDGSGWTTLQKHEFASCADVRLLALGVRLTDNVTIGVCGLVIASIVRLCAYEIPVGVQLVRRYSADHWSNTNGIGFRRTIWSAFERRTVNRLVMLGGPLAVVTFLMAYTLSVPRYVLHDHLGDAQTGCVRRDLHPFACAKNLIITSISQSLSSRLAVLFMQKQRAQFIYLISRAMALSIFIGLIGVFVAWLAGKQLLSLLFTPAYANDTDLFLILMLVGLLDGIGNIIGTAVSSMRRFLNSSTCTFSEIGDYLLRQLMARRKEWIAGSRVGDHGCNDLHNRLLRSHLLDWSAQTRNTFEK